MGTHVFTNEESLILPSLESPVGEQVTLSNNGLCKCFAEVDIIGLSMTGYVDMWIFDRVSCTDLAPEPALSPFKKQ